jgi:hypothetical protein
MKKVLRYIFNDSMVFGCAGALLVWFTGEFWLSLGAALLAAFLWQTLVFWWRMRRYQQSQKGKDQ